jgi:hypothetical protein
MDSKKRSVDANERDEFLRAAWRVMVAAATPQARAFSLRRRDGHQHFSDAPVCLLAPWRERAHARVPRNWGANVTLLASMSVRGMGPCLAVEGPTTEAVFEVYLERALAPSLCPGQVVVMDNLSSHKGSRVHELIETRGCELVYLPPYSPDLNPIEEAHSPSSRRCCARLEGAPEKPCWKRWVGRSMR